MSPSPPLDRFRILEVLNDHGVEYLVVGGVGAQLLGATRPTADLDSLASTTRENLDRLASAMNALNARLRVEGLTDDEARALAVRLAAESLDRMDISVGGSVRPLLRRGNRPRVVVASESGRDP